MAKEKKPEKRMGARRSPNRGIEHSVAEAFAAAAEHSALPVALCDAQATVLAASRGANALIRRESLLSLRDGRLQLVGEDARQRELLALIKQALTEDGHDSRDTKLVYNVVRRGKPPLSLLVSTLPEGGSQWAALYIHEPQFTARISESLLGQLYGLTVAEARVARLLVNGASLNQIAETNGTSVHTVRNQTKSVFHKTGASRQAELAILLLTGPAHTR